MPDYQGMKIADLRKVAKERGVQLPPNAKKADIVELLESGEPVAVEAEVIEPEEGRGADQLAVTFSTGQITANFDALEAKVDEILAQYDGWEPTADSKEDVEQCARERKYLNGLAKQLDERRKAVKNEYLAPLNAFEARANGIRDKIKKVSERIKAVEAEAEDYRRADKKAELREHYEAYAGLLFDVVPYDKVHEEKWLNKTCNTQKAKAELEARVDRVVADWESLKALNLEFHDDAEARFFDSLDLGEAIAWAGKLAEDKRKVEAMKAELAPEPEIAVEDEQPPVDAYEGDYDPDGEPAPYGREAAYSAVPYDGRPIPPANPDIQQPTPAQPIPAQPARVDEGAKEQVIARISSLLEWYPLNKLEKMHDALRDLADGATEGEARERVIVVSAATQGQLVPLGKILGFVGVTGVFKTGSLAEIVQQENQRAAQRAQGGWYGYGA